MGEKETSEIGPRGENINAGWDIVGKAANQEFTFPRDRRPANINAGWDIVGDGATEAFQEGLSLDSGPDRLESKYEIHDRQISPEVYAEAIEIARGLGVGVRRKRGERRIGLAKKFAATTAVVFAIYMAARDGGETKKMEIENSNTGIKLEQKKVTQKGDVEKEHSQGKTVEEPTIIGDIDGGSPGGMIEEGVPPAEAAKNVYGDGALHEAVSKRQQENTADDWQQSGGSLAESGEYDDLKKGGYIK